jgi:hypothetical protein
MQNASPIFNALNDPAANDQSLAQVLLESAAKILKPLVRLWITHGVTYQMASELLKRVYVDTAREHFVDEDASGTRLSLLTGINRKEIKRLSQDDEVQISGDGVTSFASAVHARWRNNRRFRDKNGSPRLLLRRSFGRELSFDDLVRSVTTDHRPSAVFHEMTRLGTIELVPAKDERGECVRLKQDAFLPRPNINDRLLPLTESLQDHNAAAISNVLADQPIFLERFIASDELSLHSAEVLHKQARQLWQTVYAGMMASAIECESRDSASTDQLKTRVRVGMYFYSESEKTS